MKKKLEINYEVLSKDEITSEIGTLINAAEQALLTSHAPYSNFHVGAALHLDDGSVVKGSNQENAAYPIGYCAERTAIAAKIALSPDLKISSIAISIMNRDGNILPPIAPCGMCRQALLEEENRQKSPIKVYLAGNDGSVMVINSIKELLPFQFDNSIFGV